MQAILPPRPLRAYRVDEISEGSAVIVFALTGAPARREGAQMLGSEWEGVTCRRAPLFDSYSPGPVPARALLDDGWWQTCDACGRYVSDDAAEDSAAEHAEYALDPAGFPYEPAPLMTPVTAGSRVWCNSACWHDGHADKAARALVTETLKTRFEAQVRGASVTYVGLGTGTTRPYLSFTIAGHLVNWNYGSPTTTVYGRGGYAVSEALRASREARGAPFDPFLGFPAPETPLETV